MQKENKYVHIIVNMNKDTISFNNYQAADISQFLFNFLYFDFTQTRSNQITEPVTVHPYFSMTQDRDLPIEKLIKLQHIYCNILNQMQNGVNTYELLENPYVSKYHSIVSMNIGLKDQEPVIDYMVRDFEDCLFIELLEMLRRNLRVKVCKNCQKFFVPKKGNIDYCQRVFTTDGKTCAQVGYVQTFAKNVKNDELLQAYTRAYKAHYARMTKPRKRTANMTKEEFEAWYVQAKINLDLARKGKLDAEEYKQWLKK